MRRAAILSAVLGVGISLLAVAPAAYAETEVVVFKDQITQPDTRSGGHVNWPVGGGIRLSTDSNTSLDKATFAFATGANGFALGSALIGHDVNVKSGGDQATPGVQVYTSDALFVYEDVYGDDIWATNSTPAAIKNLAPSCDGSPDAATDPVAHCTGGGGSYFHGSQAAWGAALSGAGYSPTVVALGESLGSGVKGNVLVTSLNAGDTFWTFSRQNAPVVTPDPTVVTPQSKVTGSITGSCRRAAVHVELPALDHDAEVYSTPSIKIRVASLGQTVAGSNRTLSEGQSYDVTVNLSKASGSDVVKIFHSVPQQLFKQLAINRNCNTPGAAPITVA